MKDTSALNLFPKMQVKPFDGMSITAEIWDQAHEEHRQMLRAHNLISHGGGIITGLEVVANDPSDQYVFISAGVAVDPVGNIIVVPEPVAYDFESTVPGTLYLLLGKGEREVGGVGNEAKYSQAEYVIAARTSLPKRPSVELARVTLSAAGMPIHNAGDPLHPASDALDLRYRSQVGPVPVEIVNVLVTGLGKDEADVLKGWDQLGKFSQMSSKYHIIVDGETQLPKDLGEYDFVYMGSQGDYSLSAAQLKSLAAFLEQGKILMVEALTDSAQEACQKMFKKLELKLAKPKADSPLFSSPFLFAEAPAGFSGNQVEVGKGVLYSTAGYARSWAGKAASGVASRSDIRSTHEWGLNLISLGLKQAGK
jgi:hypothetical protein